MRLTQSQIERINRLWLATSSDSKEWDESKHPRAANGQFGKGTGSTTQKTSETIPTIKGNELGTYKDIKELRANARLYAMEHFAGKKFTNSETGNEISVSMGGVKHTIVGANEELIKTIPAIPELINSASLLETRADKRNDPNVKAIEIYQAKISVMGSEKEVIITVKHHLDGRRYYDHGYMKR